MSKDLTERQRLKVENAEGLLWGYNYREAKAKETMWELEYAIQEFNTGGVRGMFLDPDKVPQKHKISGYGLDIVGLMTKREALEERYKEEKKINNEIDKWLDTIDYDSATFIRERYIERRTINEIARRYGMVPMTVRRWITAALLQFPD